MRKFLQVLIAVMAGFTSIAQVSDAEAKRALQLVSSTKASLGLWAADLNNVRVTTTYFDRSTGFTMVYLQQTYEGIPVLKQILPLAFKDGKLVSKAGMFVYNMEQIVSVKTGVPSISAETAVQTAIADRKLKASGMPVVISRKENERKIEYNNMGVSRENITAELLWVPVEASVDKENTVKTKASMRLAWQVYIIPTNSSDYWLVCIDATDNSTLRVDNLTVYDHWGHPGDKLASESTAVDKGNLQSNTSLFGLPANIELPNRFPLSPYSPSAVNSSSYRVVPFPAESPLAVGGAPAIRTNPWTAAPGNATTLGWHTGLAGVDYNYTQGNNVWAYQDRDGIDGGTLAETVYSTTTSDPLTFDFVPNFAVDPLQQAPVQNKQSNVTNLFYWTNIIHDVMYQYGFDEPAHNFQDDNLGRGGLGNDHVNAEAQDGSGTNNANFSTPNDGGAGRMQMYLWNLNAVNPNRDGDVDNGIVVHEYGHGISNRLTGGGATTCLSGAEQMGEGWSDYYALMFTTNWATASVTDGFNIPRHIGSYALGNVSIFTCPYPAPIPSCTATPNLGIRHFPYITNMAVNPWVYGAIIPSSVHDRGEIWAATLWDMTWNLIAQDGINPNLYDAAGTGGNNVAMKLVTLGLKLQPCSVGFIDGRNAILAADDALYGGAHRCAIINAFARRGMGLFASQGSSGSVTDQVPDFTADASSVVVTSNAAAVPESQNIVYTNNVTAGDAGCVSLANYTLTDTLPGNVTYVSGGIYNPANRVVSFNPVTVAPGSTQPYTFTVNINAGTYFAPVIIVDEPVAGATIPASWTVASTTATHWTVSSAQGHSAPNSFFSPDIASVSDQVIATTASFSLDATPPSLTFWHNYNTEATFDGGVVEISLDGGTNWQDIGTANFESGGYNAIISNGFSSPIGTRAAFSGNSGGFIKSTINMSAYANQANVKLRFRFGSDNSVGATGWYVDDIAMTNVPVINMRSSLFNSTDVRISKSDAVTSILAPLAVPIINAGAVTGSIAACFGTASASPAIQQFNVSGNDLTADITVNAPSNFEMSTDAGSGYGSTLNLPQTGGNVPATIIYIRSATAAPAGPISGDVSLVSAGVTTINVAVNGTIKPIPDAVATPSSQNSCTGADITLIGLTGSVSGTEFNWARDNEATVTGIPANGAGDISGVLTNTNNAPVTVTFTVTPTAAGCTTTPIAATVTVNPRPTSVISGDATVCSGSLSTNISIALTGAQPWTFTYSDGTTPVNVIGNNTNPYLVTVSSPTPQTYTVTSLSDANCSALVQDMTGSATITQLSFSIDASAGANGSISPDGVTSVNCGADQAYIITAASGFNVQDVLVDGVSQGAITDYTFTGVTAAHTISATFVAGAFTITATAGANGTITPAGSVSVTSGADQTFSIAANSCYQIADVVVDGLSQGVIATYTFTNVTAPHTISATFSQLSYNITATAGANGSITPGGVTSVNCGADQTFTITADACYQIADVIVDGVSQGAISSYSFTGVTATHTISATFSQLSYNISASAGANGSITPGGVTSVNCGADQTFTITADACYQIADVIVDGVSQGAIGTYTFTDVTATQTISATFSRLSYIITATAGANGSITPNGAASVNCGADQTFSIAANAGFAVQDVVVDGVSQGAVTSYTFTNVTATHSISATFAALPGCVRPSLSVVIGNVLCRGGSTGAINLTLTGGTGPFTYAWIGPNGYSASTEDISGLAVGRYRVIVTATGGCTAIAFYTVGQPAGTLVIAASWNPVPCFGGTTNVLVSAAGGTLPYTGAGIIPNQAAGVHTYTVTDANGCTASGTFTIIQPGAINVTATPGTIACGATTTNVTVTAAGGFPPYTGTGVRTLQTAGVQIYTVTDARGCTGSATITIAGSTGTPPARPTLVTGPAYGLCGGGTFTYMVAAVPGATGYTWAVPASFSIVGGQSTSQLQVLVPANFSGQATIGVTATSTCGTGSQYRFSVFGVLYYAPAAISGPSTVNPGQANVQYNLPFTAGATYNWLVPSGATIVNGQGTNNLTVTFGTRSGNVSVDIQNACGTAPRSGKFVTVALPLTIPLPKAAPADQLPITKVYFNVYPNPAQSNATVAFSSLKAGSKFEVVVSNTIGNILLTKSGVTISGKNQLLFDLGKFTNGMYLVTLKTDDTIQTQKLLKQQ